MSAVTFGIQNLFSFASREQFMRNLNKFRVPSINTYNRGIQPEATAAVLVPLCAVNDVPTLLYTERSAQLKSHSGEISFPGGKTDNDETPTETALRETQEEIGLLPVKIDVWGHGPVLPSIDFKTMVTPVIGSVANLKEGDLCVNKNEVNEVFAVPLQDLCDPKNQFHYQYSSEIIVPVYIGNKYKIWGITAYMTHMFLSCLLSKDVYGSDWMKRKIDIKDLELK